MSELEDFVAEDSEDFETVDETAAVPQAEAAPEGEMDTSDETVEQEAEPTSAEPQTQETHEPQMVPLAAKQAEKDRRIRAERELEALQAQLSRQSDDNKPDIFDNPDLALNNLRMEIRAEISEGIARDKYEDYDEVMDHYTDMVKQNPALHAKVMQSPMSAIEAYKTAKNDIAMKEIGNPMDYRERLKQELLAELQAEQKKKPSVPPDLTTARSAGTDPKMQDISEGTDGLMELLGR